MTRRATEIRDQAPAATARCPVRMEARVVRRAKGRDAHLLHAQRLGLRREHRANIDMRLAADRRAAQGLGHFRTYFIAQAPNSYAAMHYNIPAIRTPVLDPGGNAPRRKPRPRP